MKLEKLNENQIRCTLSKEDLAGRDIKLSEFAYGTPKTKELFREVMSWASYKFGFESKNTPLMVEAVPLSKDSIMLIVTKVENPDVLDSRYSKYSPSDEDDMDDFTPEPPKRAPEKVRIDAWEKEEGCYPKLFAFESMNDLIHAVKQLPEFTAAEENMFTARLYFDPKKETYFLYASSAPDPSSADVFDRICTLLSEYGKRTALPDTGDAYLREHCETVLDTDVIATLKNL